MEPQTLQQAILYFADPANCREYLVARRWPNGVACPRCGSGNVLFLEKYNRWHCREKHDAPQFTLKTGTVFEDSPVGLDKWLTALWLVVNCKNGISSYEISRDLKVTQKTAWFMLHRLREALKDDRTHKFGFGGPVEGDETYVGPNPAKMHKSRKAKVQARDGMKGGMVGKTAVQGLLDRELRQVRTRVLKDVKRETLQNTILENVTPFAKVYTDEATVYDNLGKNFIHKVVNHTQEYVKGQVHTQGIDNYWSLLKRTLRGTYVAVEPFHLDRYCDEQAFRFNNRATKDNPLTDADRFALAATQIVGKRLTYKELTGKEGGTSAEPF
jgi:transposase-like protein